MTVNIHEQNRGKKTEAKLWNEVWMTDAKTCLLKLQYVRKLLEAGENVFAFNGNSDIIEYAYRFHSANCKKA